MATANQYDFGALKMGVFVCSSFSLLLCVVTFLPISYLLVRHCRLTLRGVTFY